MGYAITLKNLLENEKMNDLTMINPNEDLERKTSMAESIKTPDIISFFPSNIPLHMFGWNDGDKNLINILNLQKKFYNLMSHGASLKRLLNMLSTALKTHLIVIDMFGEICASSNLNPFEEQVAVNLVKELNEKTNESDYRVLSEYGKKKNVFIYPIRLISRNTHYVIAFCDGNTENLSEFVMEELLLMFSTYFYKSLYVNYSEMQFKNNFLKILVEANKGEQLSSGQILAIGKEHMFRSSAYYCVVLARFLRKEKQRFCVEQFMRKEEQYILVYGYLKRKIEKNYSHDIIILPDIENWRYVFLLQEKRENLDALLNEIGNIIYKVLNEKMLFAYGNSAYDVSSIANSYWEAVETLANMTLKQENTILHYQPQNVMQLLKGMSSRQIDEVCKRTLKDLAFPEDEMNLELQKTLKVYLDCHCSIMETANRMYLHRNTVRYRIKKCEEILENDLSDWDYCFQLQLCLMLSDV